MENKGESTFKIDNTDVIIYLDDVEINYKDIEGLSVASGNGITIALDLKLNDSLINEGIARELVNRIQNIRKDAGLGITDKIDISFLANADLKEKIENNITYIRSETLGEKIDFLEKMNDGTEVVFDNIKTQITIKRI